MGLAELAVPTVQEELERKTWAEIDRLYRHFEDGKISPLEYRSSLETIWNVSSGLVNNGFAEAVRGCNAQLKLAGPQMNVTVTNFLHHDDTRLMRVVHDHDHNCLTAKRLIFADGAWEEFVTLRSFDNALNPSQAAMTAYKMLVETITDMGYERL